MWIPPAPLEIDEDTSKAVKLLNVTRLHNFFDIDEWSTSASHSSDSEYEQNDTEEVCHHSDCQASNDQHPLMLCADCDHDMHGQHNNAHLRFDLINKNCQLNRKVSTRSLPSMAVGSYHSDDEEEKQSCVERIEGAAVTKYDEVDMTAREYAIDKVLEKKSSSNRLKRKKVMKGRRHHTDDHRRSLSYCGGEESCDLGHKEDVTFADDTCLLSRLMPRYSKRGSYERSSGHMAQSPAAKKRAVKNQRLTKNLNDHEFTIATCVYDYHGDTDEELFKKIVDKNASILIEENNYVTDDDTHTNRSEECFENGVDCDGISQNREAESDRTESLKLNDEHNQEDEHTGAMLTTMASSDLPHSGTNYSVISHSEDTQKVDLKKTSFDQNLDGDTTSDILSSAPPSEEMTSEHCVIDQSASTEEGEDEKKSCDQPAQKLSIGMEHFTLKFDIFEEPEMEIVAAVKGITLREALCALCDKRGVNVDKVHIFLAASNTPLPLNIDTFHLGGNHLHVKRKDGDSPFSRGSNFKPNGGGPTKLRSTSTTSRERDRTDKKVAGNSRGRRTFSEDSGTDISPHGTLTGLDSQRLRTHNRAGSKLSTLFSPFVVKAEKLEHLNELLHQYSTQGLPSMPELLTIGQPEYDSKLFSLETHWTDVVDNAHELSKRVKDHQEAVWELMRTEVNYIKIVKVVLDLFMCCLINLQNMSLLNEIDTEKLFSNLRYIIYANSSFWCEYLLPVVAEARKTRQPLNPTLMTEGFLKFEEIFHPYTKYCLDQEVCLEYIKSRFRDNELFKTFVMWAETQKACGRLKLIDLIVKPWQRLTRYSLLLNAILKKSDLEEEKDCLRGMIEHVDSFVRHVNTTMRQRHEQERVAVIMNRIESYDAVDAPNDESTKIIQEFSNLDLHCPVPGCSPAYKRQLLHEGALKLRDSYTKMDVYCFLLTDMFLVTKQSKRGDKVKVIKPPMRLDKIVIQDLRDASSFLLIHLNEFHMVSSAYVFQGEARLWSRNFSKAQEAYKEARQVDHRAETRLIGADMYDETDEDYMYGPPPPYPHDNNHHNNYMLLDHHNNRDSTLSVERFMPSHMQRAGSSDTLLMDQAEDEGDETTNRPRSATFSGNEYRRPMSPVNKSPSLGDKISQYTGLTTPKSTNSPSRSPNSGRRLSGKKPPPVPPKPTLSPGKSPELINYVNEERFMDLLPGKLNQRRVSRTEKRYYTADAIQELQKDKDTSIHKRLSWSYGTVDISIDDRVGHLKGRVISSDSIRSVPSSSGVSSTGSLHHTEDSISSNDPQQTNFMDSDMQMIITSPEETSGVNGENQHTNSNKVVMLRSSSSNSDSGSNKGSNDAAVVAAMKSNSKSLPDISQLHLSTGEVQDGIASVHIGKPEGQRRKLSHAQVLRMKKQLLLNSTLEASEV